MRLYLTAMISLATLFALQGTAQAQGMSLNNPQLTSGQNLQAGATYRFSNVTDGIDAVVSVDSLNQVELLDMDADSSISNHAWSPVFAGTGGYGLHYADFTVLFFANGTDTPRAPENFSTSVHGNDLSQAGGGFVMEFVQVAGFTSIVNADDSVQSITYADGSQLAMANQGSDSWLAAWDFENKPGYSIRFGWQGDNGPETGRQFNALMSGSLDNSIPTFSGQDASIKAIPEPSSTLLFVLSVFPLVLRRKRQEKI